MNYEERSGCKERLFVLFLRFARGVLPFLATFITIIGFVGMLPTFIYLENKVGIIGIDEYIRLFFEPIFLGGLALFVIGVTLDIIAVKYRPVPQKVFSSEMEDLLKKADDAHDRHDYDDELSFLNRITEMEGAPTEVFVRIADVYLLKEEYSTAYELYSDILKTDSGCSAACIGATECLIAQNRFDEAFPFAEKCTSLVSPKSDAYPGIMAKYALVAGKCGDMETFEYALEHAEQAGYTESEQLREMLDE